MSKSNFLYFKLSTETRLNSRVTCAAFCRLLLELYNGKDQDIEIHFNILYIVFPITIFCSLTNLHFFIQYLLILNFQTVFQNVTLLLNHYFREPCVVYKIRFCIYISLLTAIGVWTAAPLPLPATRTHRRHGSSVLETKNLKTKIARRWDGEDSELNGVSESCRYTANFRLQMSHSYKHAYGICLRWFGSLSPQLSKLWCSS